MCVLKIVKAGHSTSKVLIKMYDNWVDGLEEGNMIGVMIIDLSAAFDLVDHTLLLQNLELIGFDHHDVMWMWGYLVGRSQSVYVAGKFSAGEPQGSWSSSKCTS